MFKVKKKLNPMQNLPGFLTSNETPNCLESDRDDYILPAEFHQQKEMWLQVKGPFTPRKITIKITFTILASKSDHDTILIPAVLLSTALMTQDL